VVKLYTDKERFREDYKIAKIIVFATMVIYIPLIALFIFQITQGIVHIFSIAPIGMIGFIIYFNICINSGNKEKKEVVAVEADNKEVMASNLIVHNTAIGKKDLIARVIAMTILLVLTILFSLLYVSARPMYSNVVNATIIDQEGGTVREDYVTETGETINRSETACKLTVRYQFNGETIEKEIILKNVTEIYQDTMEICLDSEGKYVCATSAISFCKIMAYTTGTACVLILLSMIFSFAFEFFVFVIMAMIGFALTWFINMYFIANMFYNPLTVFSGFFAITGVFGLMGVVLNKIFIK
jgi:hypothetical protein